MRIHFKGSDYEMTPRAEAHATKRVAALRKYLPRRHRENAYAYVDLGRETGEHHNAGPIWRADINFDANGTRFYAKAIEETIENAIDRATDELASELRTARTRRLALARRGGLLFKAMLRSAEV